MYKAIQKPKFQITPKNWIFWLSTHLGQHKNLIFSILCTQIDQKRQVNPVSTFLCSHKFSQNLTKKTKYTPQTEKYKLHEFSINKVIKAEIL